LPIDAPNGATKCDAIAIVLPELASPRPSLIISDEELRSEIGKGHGFRFSGARKVGKDCPDWDLVCTLRADDRDTVDSLDPFASLSIVCPVATI
jgi:hypothetical protein